MIGVMRVIFVVISGLVGFIAADSLGFSQINGVILGIIASLAVVLIDVFSGKISLKDIIAMLVGLVIGLVLAALLVQGVAWIKLLDNPKFTFLPLVIYVICIYLFVSTALRKKEEIFGMKFSLGKHGDRYGSAKILDTSVIIDGRVAELLKIGFVDGEILVPKFVLHELQLIADSPDALKRTRGRRGLDILNDMQKTLPNIKITDEDYPEIHGVDEKLLKMAKKYHGKIVTNDFNLNKVAEVQKIKILNLNELSNAIKSIAVAGETMRVKILKEGKEAQQGVAYLEDGTMIVVDGAKGDINKTIDIVITSVIQTSAGRMIFAKRKED